MAVVGEAHVIVRAITNRVKPDIERAFSGIDRIGEREGARISDAFDRGLNSGGGGRGRIFGGKFADEAEAARRKFQRLVQVGYFLGPIITGLVGAIGSLGAGLVTLSTILSRATPAAIALGGALAALAQGALTAVLAFGGVGKAISAGNKATASGVNNARALERAQKRLAEAIKAKEDFEAEITDRNIERQRRLQDVNDALADAQINLQRVGRNYLRAQKRSLDAQEAVTKAREDAKEAIQQLRFELEGGAISEKKARLEFEKARDSLQRVQDLPPNSRARQEAELAFAEAELNLRKAIDRNQDLKKEEAAATKAGVEGSKAVRDASYAAAEAKQAEEDALVDLSREQRDFEKLTIDTAKARKELSYGEFKKQIKEERQELKDAIKEARKDLEDLKKNAGGAASAYQKALQELSPEARKFVEFIVENRKEFQKLRDAAARGLFPGLEVAIQKLIDKLFPVLIPLLEGTGGALANVANKIADVVTEESNLEQLERVWKTGDKLIENFGGAIANLIDLFLTLLDAGRPVIEEFGQWIEDLTGGWAKDAEGNFSTIQTRMEEAATIVKRLAGIFGTLFDAFGSIGESVVNGGALDRLLTYFEEASSDFATLMENMNGDGSLGEYFLKATENATKVLDLLGNIIGEILKLGAGDGVGSFIDSLNEAVDIFGEIGAEIDGALPAFGEFIVEFAKVIKTFTESGSIQTFFEILTGGLEVVNKVFGNETVKKIFLFVAPIFAATRAFALFGKVGFFAFKVFAGGILFPLRAMEKLTTALLKVPGAGGRLVGKFKAFGSAFKGAAASILKPIAKVLGKLKGFFAKILTIVGKFLLTLGRLLMANPWILLIVALIAIVTLVVMNWDKIKEIVGNAMAWISEKVSAVWNAIVEFFKTVGGKIIGAIGDFATSVLEFINKYHPIMVIWRLISENWEAIKTWFVELPGKVLDFIKEFGGKVLEFINKYHPVMILWRLITENWDKIKGWFTSLPGRVKDAIVGLSTKVAEFIRKYHPILILWNKAKELWPTVYQFFKDKLDALIGFFRGLPQRFKNAASGLWDFLKDGFVGILNKMITAWNNFSLRLEVPSNAVTDFFRIGGKGFTINTPDIPPINLASGGVVYPRPGGTLARIAEAGRPERVEPLDENGLSKRDKALVMALAGGGGPGGTTINVYPSEGMNERELAKKVSTELASMMRRGAA